MTMQDEPLRLSDKAVGQWVVRTEASTYLLDMDERTLRRTTGFSQSQWPSVPLRRDGEAVPLREVVSAQVGEPAMFLIDVRTDGVPTLRRTTPVVEIRVVL